MTRNPLVSIIINNYNYGRFLAEAIDSALAQTYQNIEVIVVDDGSTDNSTEIIAGYGSKIITVLKQNGGQGSAYNVGFLKSNGQLICNLDADDTLLPKAMERAISYFEDENIIKIQWPLLIVDKEGKPTGEISTKWTPPEGDLKEMVLDAGPFYDFHFHVGSIVSRQLLEYIFPMPEQPYKNGGDVYVTTLTPLFGRIRNCAQALGTYRVHGNNNYVGRVIDDERIRNYIDRFEANCLELERFAGNLGYAVRPEVWRQKNFNYLWPTRLLQAKEDIEQTIPSGTSYLLVNDNEWGDGEPIKERTAIPFLEFNGEYAGLPADDETAISELERLKKSGASFLVFWWTSFWWLDYYSGLNSFLREQFKCVLENDRLVVFKITSET